MSQGSILFIQVIFIALYNITSSFFATLVWELTNIFVLIWSISKYKGKVAMHKLICFSCRSVAESQKSEIILFAYQRLLVFICYTVGPRYMREIGTPKIDSHIMNSHIKRSWMTDN
jgi:hypothetical protein